MTECRSFIERAEEEAVEAAVSWNRARLPKELEVQAVPVPTTSEVLRLQAMVSQLQVEKEELLRMPEEA